MATLTDIRQLEGRESIPQISNTAPTVLKDIVLGINSEVTPPLQLSVTGSNKVVTIANITVTNPNTLKNRTIPTISNTLPTFASGTVTVAGSGAGGTVTVSPGSSSITLAMTANQFMKVGINLDATGNLILVAGTPAASLASATAPAGIASAFAIGYFVVRTDGSNVTTNILGSDIYQYVGGGGSGGSGTGNPTLETLKNQFVDSPFQLLTPNIISTDAGSKFASYTGASYDVANSVVKFTANSQIATSTQMLDSVEFLPYGIDMTSVDLSVFWNKGTTIQAFSVPDAATTYSGLNVTVTNTSTTVIVTTPVEHKLKTGSRITVTTATAIGGISSGNLSQSNTAITVLSPQQFSYVAGGAASSTASGTLDTLAVLGFQYEVSRDGGTNWFTVPMGRVGTTEAFRGPFTWDNSTANTEITQQSLATQTGTIITRTLAASSTDQQLSQSFVVTAGQTWVIKKVILNVTKTGTPGGNLFVSLVKDSSGVPSLTLADTLGQSSAVVASGLTTGANTITLPTTVLTPGTYHVVVSSDAAYKATGTFGSNNIALQEASSLTGESSYNGTIWSTVASRGLIYTLQGRSLDLRVRFSSPTSGTFTYPSGLDGYGIFYNLQDVGIVGQNKKNQKFVFNSVTDNLSSFALTAFNPDPDLLTCWYIEGGQGFKVPAFNLNGNTAVFPANTFNNGGVSATMTLVFEQNNGGGYDNSDMNANLLAQNFLGSEATTYDRSSTGRGIKIRNASGLLREISLDASDNIIINSLP